jgi:hypothetical protein
MTYQTPAPMTPVGALHFTGRQEASTLELTLSGSAELRSSEQLALALLQWHEHAMGLGVQWVSVDFRGVEFMNSSALSAFLQWFKRLSITPGSYKVQLVYDTAVRWQRGSISALGSFAVDFVTVSHIPTPLPRPMP